MVDTVSVRWFSRKNSSPPMYTRILIFSPMYPENDERRIRIIEGQFFIHTKEATHWAYLPEEPDLD